MSSSKIRKIPNLLPPTCSTHKGACTVHACAAFGHLCEHAREFDCVDFLLNCFANVITYTFVIGLRCFFFLIDVSIVSICHSQYQKMCFLCVSNNIHVNCFHVTQNLQHARTCHHKRNEYNVHIFNKFVFENCERFVMYRLPAIPGRLQKF